MDFETWSTENGVRSIEYLSRSVEYIEWKIENMDYGICGMESVRDYCSKLSRCIFDRKLSVISGMRTESKAGL